MFVGFDKHTPKSVKFNTRQARGNLAVNLEDKSLTAWGEIKAR